MFETMAETWAPPVFLLGASVAAESRLWYVVGACLVATAWSVYVLAQLGAQHDDPPAD